MIMNEQFNLKFKLYQITVIFSMLFALVGFSYNVWRMEVSEQNNTIRTASFEMLVELSSLEQLIYTAHYDGDVAEGSPRKAWVKVGLIVDLSVLTAPSVQHKANTLKGVWAANWDSISHDNNAVNNVVTEIDIVRSEIKLLLKSLE